MTEPTEKQIAAAWEQATPLKGYDPKLYRMAPDLVQAVIRRDRFDKRGKYGWRIECGKPVSYHRLSMESAIRRVGRDMTAKRSKQTVAR